MKKILIFALALVLLFSVFIVPASAASGSLVLGYNYNGYTYADVRKISGLPSPFDVIDDSLYLYLIDQVDSDGTHFGQLAILTVPIYYDGSSGTYLYSDTGKMLFLTLNPRNGSFYNYTYQQQRTVSEGDIFATHSVIWSTSTVMNTYDLSVHLNPDLNFFHPLYLEQQPLVERMMTEITLPTLVGQMRVIALCGVGCLALVISLKLFGKVFRIFRVL